MPPFRCDAVCFTFDIDWAPEPMIDALRELLAAHDLPATIFCTHPSPATERLLALPRCETAVHPNFLSGRPPGAVLDEVLGWFPAARGVRNHGLSYSSRLLPLLHRAGAAYLSNDLAFLQPDLRPTYDWSGLVRLPIYWEDDVHCVYFDGVPADHAFDPARVPLDRPGLHILDFHPVHLFLNTGDLSVYTAAKERLRDPDQARALRNPGPGVRTLFDGLVDRLSGRLSGRPSESLSGGPSGDMPGSHAADPAAPRPCMTLSEVAREFCAHESYTGHYHRYLARTETP